MLSGLTFYQKSTKKEQIMQQYPCSPELLAGKQTISGPRSKGLDFEHLVAGYSYAIPIDQCNIASLQVQCSKYSKQLNAKFKLHYHRATGIVEVGRIDGVKATTINQADEDVSLSISIE
jgi:hypothetical protein